MVILSEKKANFVKLPFVPLKGLKSPHLQTILANFSPNGKPPPSEPYLFQMDDGDILWCEISTPPNWKEDQKTIVLLHGLGGNISSGYMIRLCRKFYQAGFRVLRVNMRGSGDGKKLVSKPYHGGLSSDIKTVLEKLKEKNPLSPIVLIGFSLSANMVLKLAGELGEEAKNLLEKTIAICPPIDLKETSDILAHPLKALYNRYYLFHMDKQAKRWTNKRKFSHISEFDFFVTANQWGFKSADDYYQQCSSRYFISKIRHPCRIAVAWDDPFVNYSHLFDIPLSSDVKVGLSKHGGHMGFLGKANREHGYFWMDFLLFSWINDHDNDFEISLTNDDEKIFVKAKNKFNFVR